MRLRALVMQQLQAECFGGTTFHVDNKIETNIKDGLLLIHGKFVLQQSNLQKYMPNFPPPAEELPQPSSCGQRALQNLPLPRETHRNLSPPCENFEESLSSSIELIHHLEPQIPWSPGKSVSPHKFAEPLSTLLTSPETRPLLAPFITAVPTEESKHEVATEGEAMEEARGDCTAKLAHFNSLLKRYTPKESNKAAVNRLGNEWITNLEKSWS